MRCSIRDEVDGRKIACFNIVVLTVVDKNWFGRVVTSGR